jgi:F-type H+-transporting ATPase subunit delta
MAATKQIRSTARALFKLSVENGQLSEAKVREILAWFEQKRPPRAAAILREYLRSVAREVRRSRARIEHAGALPPGAVASILAELSRVYRRSLTAETREDPALIAGVRISIGDDVFERSLASQLDLLSSATA